MWAACQLSVLAIGLTCLDHCEPDSKITLPTASVSTLSGSTFPFPSSKGRVSSGSFRPLRARHGAARIRRRPYESEGGTNAA